MDSFFYSKYTKITAAILFAGLLAYAANALFSGVVELFGTENAIQNFSEELFYQVVFLCGAALAMLAYLIAACGKRADRQEIVLMRIDSVWTEIHLAVLFAVTVTALSFIVYMTDDYYRNDTAIPEYLARTAVTVTAFIEAVVAETILLSVIRNVKNRSFLKRSIVIRLLLWLWSCVRHLLRMIAEGFRSIKTNLASKTGVYLSVILLGYTAFIGFCGVRLSQGSGWLLAAIGGFAAACVYLGKRTKDLDEIRSGVSEIRNGNLTCKLTDISCEDYKELAQNINDIGEGLSASVADTLRAERMKTELITNVSHDLKTPLTSIINYTKLLEEMELSPPEAEDYVKIIAKKSERLKNLTTDLFEISRVQSGNEEVVLEKLDVVLLIQQSLGEHDSEIKNSGLTFCVNADEGLYVMADGRKLSRVLSNLIENILKYAMKNTRVFVSAHADDRTAILEWKNISAYPIDFSAEEITERFVRGDQARSEEGNGLGLAIAKGYTEVCGGSLRVVTDGDLFKVLLKFDLAS